MILCKKHRDAPQIPTLPSMKPQMRIVVDFSQIA
jgi:hypothetical protein